MEIKTGISLQTKQQLSQLQVESLNILAMSMTELKDFLQNEEIENPLVEYTSGKEEAAPITYKETERFYNGTDRDERRENELYEIEDSEKSLPSSGGMIFQRAISTFFGSLIPSTRPIRFVRRIQWVSVTIAGFPNTSPIIRFALFLPTPGSFKRASKSSGTFP